MGDSPELRAAKMLADALDRLDSTLQAWGAGLEAPHWPEAAHDDTHRSLKERIEDARRLSGGKLRWEARGGLAAPWMVALAGGTNVGKSQIFNSLVEDAIAHPDPRGAQTRLPVAYLHRDDERTLRSSLSDRWLLMEYTGSESLNRPRPSNGPPPLVVRTHDRDEWRGIVLIDTPDIDSDALANRALAMEVVAGVDAVIAVTVAEKYNDTTSVDLLKLVMREGRALTILFNFATDKNRAAFEHLKSTVLPAVRAGALSAGNAVEVLALEPVYDVEKRQHELAQKLAGLRRSLTEQGATRLRRKAEVMCGLLAEVERSLDAMIATDSAVRADMKSRREEVEQWLDRTRSRFQRMAEDRPLDEMDEVFQRLYDKLEIPYIDRVLNLAGSAFRAGLRLLGIGYDPPVTAATAREHWSDKEAQADDEARAALGDLIASWMEREGIAQSILRARHATSKLVPERLGLGSMTAGDKQRLNNALAALEEDLSKMLIEKPALRNSLMGARLALMATGAGVLITTAGLGAAGSAAIGAAGAMGIRRLMEELGKQWLEGHRSRLLVIRQEAIDSRLNVLRDPIFDRLGPPWPDTSAQALAEARAALAAASTELASHSAVDSAPAPRMSSSG